MPEQPGFNNIAALNSVWGRRALDLPTDFEINTAVTPEDIAFLANRNAYIQMINSQAVLSGMLAPVLIDTPNGWTIHDYGQAMSVSPGESLLEESTTYKGKGTGTVVNQAFAVAKEMVALAIEKGWAGIEIIAGVRLMEWSIWMAAEDKGFEVFGFEPNQQEKEKRARIKQLQESKAPVKQPGLARDQ